LEDVDTCNVPRRHKLLQCQRWGYTYNRQFKEVRAKQTRPGSVLQKLYDSLSNAKLRTIWYELKKL
jgi:hypothetical protein